MRPEDVSGRVCTVADTVSILKGQDTLVLPEVATLKLLVLLVRRQRQGCIVVSLLNLGSKRIIDFGAILSV